MRIWTVIAALACAAGEAGAQTQALPCGAPAAGGAIFQMADLPPGGKLLCMPAPGGEGQKFTLRFNGAGVTSWWYCPVPMSPSDPAVAGYKLAFGAATWERLKAGDLKPDTSLADPALARVWCPHWAEMFAGIPAAPPRPGSWATASGLSYLASKAGLTGPAGPISRGLVCDCSAALRIGSSTYCPFTGAAAGVVALCKPL